MRYLAVLLLAVPTFAQNPSSSSTIEKERALGRSVVSSLERESKPFDVPRVADYVRRIGNRLVAQHEFLVVDKRDAAEPIGLPGGFVVVPARMFLNVQDEDEFAGLLAHAIGHVAQDQTIRVERGQNLASVPLIFMGGSVMGSHALTPGGSALMPVSLAGRQRAFELEADAVGIDLATRAGFSGSGLRRYIERVQGPDRPYSFLPAREVRLARIDERLAAGPSNAASTNEEFRAAQAAVRDAISREKPDRPPTLRRARADR